MSRATVAVGAVVVVALAVALVVRLGSDADVQQAELTGDEMSKEHVLDRTVVSEFSPPRPQRSPPTPAADDAEEVPTYNGMPLIVPLSPEQVAAARENRGSTRSVIADDAIGITRTFFEQAHLTLEQRRAFISAVRDVGIQWRAAIEETSVAGMEGHDARSLIPDAGKALEAELDARLREILTEEQHEGMLDYGMWPWLVVTANVADELEQLYVVNDASKR
jgi:hypothetical protein